MLCIVLILTCLLLKDAFRHNFDSGSTATVILMAENQILVANIGDSKAFLCSEEYKSQEEAKGQKFSPLGSMSSNNLHGVESYL